MNLLFWLGETRLIWNWSRSIIVNDTDASYVFLYKIVTYCVAKSLIAIPNVLIFDSIKLISEPVSTSYIQIYWRYYIQLSKDRLFSVWMMFCVTLIISLKMCWEFVKDQTIIFSIIVWFWIQEQYCLQKRTYLWLWHYLFSKLIDLSLYFLRLGI